METGIEMAGVETVVEMAGAGDCRRDGGGWRLS